MDNCRPHRNIHSTDGKHGIKPCTSSHATQSTTASRAWCRTIARFYVCTFMGTTATVGMTVIITIFWPGNTPLIIQQGRLGAVFIIVVPEAGRWIAAIDGRTIGLQGMGPGLSAVIGEGRARGSHPTGRSQSSQYMNYSQQ